MAKAIFVRVFMFKIYLINFVKRFFCFLVTIYYILRNSLTSYSLICALVIFGYAYARLITSIKAVFKNYRTVMLVPVLYTQHIKKISYLTLLISGKIVLRKLKIYSQFIHNCSFFFRFPNFFFKKKIIYVWSRRLIKTLYRAYFLANYAGIPLVIFLVVGVIGVFSIPHLRAIFLVLFYAADIIDCWGVTWYSLIMFSLININLGGFIYLFRGYFRGDSPVDSGPRELLPQIDQFVDAVVELIKGLDATFDFPLYFYSAMLEGYVSDLEELAVQRNSNFASELDLHEEAFDEKVDRGGLEEKRRNDYITEKESEVGPRFYLGLFKGMKLILTKNLPLLPHIAWAEKDNSWEESEAFFRVKFVDIFDELIVLFFDGPSLEFFSVWGGFREFVGATFVVFSWVTAFSSSEQASLISLVPVNLIDYLEWWPFIVVRVFCESHLECDIVALIDLVNLWPLDAIGLCYECYRADEIFSARQVFDYVACPETLFVPIQWLKKILYCWFLTELLILTKLGALMLEIPVITNFSMIWNVFMFYLMAISWVSVDWGYVFDLLFLLWSVVWGCSAMLFDGFLATMWWIISVPCSVLMWLLSQPVKLFFGFLFKNFGGAYIAVPYEFFLLLLNFWCAIFNPLILFEWGAVTDFFFKQAAFSSSLVSIWNIELLLGYFLLNCTTLLKRSLVLKPLDRNAAALNGAQGAEFFANSPIMGDIIVRSSALTAKEILRARILPPYLPSALFEVRVIGTASNSNLHSSIVFDFSRARTCNAWARAYSSLKSFFFKKRKLSYTQLTNLLDCLSIIMHLSITYFCRKTKRVLQNIIDYFFWWFVSPQFDSKLKPGVVTNSYSSRLNIFLDIHRWLFLPFSLGTTFFEANYWFNERFLFVLQARENTLVGMQGNPVTQDTNVNRVIPVWRATFNSRLLFEFEFFNSHLQFFDRDLSPNALLTKYFTKLDVNAFNDGLIIHRRLLGESMAYNNYENFFNERLQLNSAGGAYWVANYLDSDMYEYDFWDNRSWFRFMWYDTTYHITNWFEWNEFVLWWTRFMNPIGATIIVNLFTMLTDWPAANLFSARELINLDYLPRSIFWDMQIFKLMGDSFWETGKGLDHDWLHIHTITVSREFYSKTWLMWRLKWELLLKYRHRFGYWPRKRVTRRKNFVFPNPYTIFDYLNDMPLTHLPINDGWVLSIDEPRLRSLMRNPVTIQRLIGNTKRMWRTNFRNDRYFIRRGTIRNRTYGGYDSVANNFFYEKPIFRATYLNKTMPFSIAARRNDLSLSGLRFGAVANGVKQKTGSWSPTFMVNNLFIRTLYYKFWSAKQFFSLKVLEHEKFSFFKSLRNKAGWRFYMRRRRGSIPEESLCIQRRRTRTYLADRRNRRIAFLFRTLRNNFSFLLYNTLLGNKAPYSTRYYSTWFLDLNDDGFLFLLKAIDSNALLSRLTYIASDAFLGVLSGVSWVFFIMFELRSPPQTLVPFKYVFERSEFMGLQDFLEIQQVPDLFELKEGGFFLVTRKINFNLGAETYSLLTLGGRTPYELHCVYAGLGYMVNE